MQGLLTWLLASPLRSGLAAAALAASRLFDLFGAGMIALVALRRGTPGALLAGAVAMPLLIGAGWLSGTGFALPLAVLALWMPVLVLAGVLRQTGSLALMMQAGVGLAVLLLAAWYVADADPAATVRTFLQQQFLPILERMQGQPAAVDGERLEALAQLAPGMLAAGGLTAAVLAVLIGRWWQAIAFNPGGFREDFHRLRQGRSAALVTAALLLAAAGTAHPLLIGAALAAALALVFQGIALVHGVIAAARQSAMWLWGMYGLLLILPVPTLALLCVAGGLDNWLDFRRLAGQRATNE